MYEGSKYTKDAKLLGGGGGGEKKSRLASMY
jgi:hypothetical protein